MLFLRRTPGSWVNRNRIAHARCEQPVSGPDRARIRELERENAELREKLISLKKRRLLRVRDSMTLATYELIDAEKACHSIVKMCAWLDVSRSGYYEWHAVLTRRSEHCSAEPVRALMREQGLVPAQVRAFRPATTIQGDVRGIPDLVGRDFTAGRPARRSSANAACGGLKPPPAGRLRRAYLHHSRSTAFQEAPTYIPHLSSCVRGTPTSPTSAPGRASSTWPR
ncbi:hypothetical protein [Nonomuraea rubra]|uniref:hypothetical protein n=1 Tax=Nonomuraea rubra TaxID=46180 RepID=UPI0033E3A9E1